MADDIDGGEVDYTDLPPFPQLPEIDLQENPKGYAPERVDGGIMDRKDVKGLVVREARAKRH